MNVILFVFFLFLCVFCFVFFLLEERDVKKKKEKNMFLLKCLKKGMQVVWGVFGCVKRQMGKRRRNVKRFCLPECLLDERQRVGVADVASHEAERVLHALGLVLGPGGEKTHARDNVDRRLL